MPPQIIIDLWNESKNKKDFEEKLIERGFKCIGAGKYSAVYGCSRVNFVVKVGLGVSTSKLPKSLDKFRLPYIFTNGNRQIAIQQKVRIERQYEAQKLIRAACGDNIDIEDYDIHKENVGWFRGRPVIIDYLAKRCQSNDTA